jgi:phosphoglycerol transferase MdoB-like AlkP superfamily enzyme
MFTRQLRLQLNTYVITFVFIQFIFRMCLALREWHNLTTSAGVLMQNIAVGAVVDLATLAYILPPLLLVHALLACKSFSVVTVRRIYTLLFGLFSFFLMFTAVSEWLYWDELTSRFNFIAVDYLIYMDEVMGNIRESYNLIFWFSLLFIATGLCTFGYHHWLVRTDPQQPSRRSIFKACGVAVLGAITSFLLVSEDISTFSHNRYNNELAKNGIFSLFAAFRNNELDYDTFYLTQKQDTLISGLRPLLDAKATYLDHGITRHITGNTAQKNKPNVVLITVESLSADYLGVFGNTQHLTPNLDKLANESLFFEDVYAAGTRTVYGLSAVTLSIPPIPGNSIVRRPNNGDLFTLGNVLNSKGYESRFIYGGFGYFDNMNAFFGGNGYRIIDRESFSKEEVSFANIWGVCDEDVFNRTLKENDISHAQGKPFFDMIMTTSNHQPFTYPEGKIDIPSGTKRLGGVKYTDYAIGKFLEDAKTKPWFDNTIFVIVADHTAGSSGKQELSPEHHHIPMLFYAPKLIAPQRVTHMVSQIDLAPTLLGLMKMDYNSRFYGTDQLSSPKERAFIANYQFVGLLKPKSMLVLKPRQQHSLYVKEGKEFTHSTQQNDALLKEAIIYFQSASRWREWSKDISRTEHSEAIPH